MKKVKAVFDIGKSNKKCFLFDEHYEEVHRVYTSFDKLEDEDGFPCDDIAGIERWMKATLGELMEQFEIESLNFSGYGASFVHIGNDGKAVAVYDYLKPIPEEMIDEFYSKYGGKSAFCQLTASPPLAMLNSGLQLYWLKYAKNKVYQKVKWSLHLPQYLSYCFTGKAFSDYTSIGCHTGLWDYTKQDYHRWVYAEGIDRILAPIVSTDTSFEYHFKGKTLKVGVGIHDSSSALLPYLKKTSATFLLLSTGTWSIALNPFNQEALTTEELNKDCLQFLRIDGKMVKASRLFLGNEYSIWVKKMASHFHKESDAHKSIRVNLEIIPKLKEYPKHCFKWESLGTAYPSSNIPDTDLDQFPSFEFAYHKLMQELTELQIEAMLLAIGTTKINQVFIDGGFVASELFLYFLEQAMPNIRFIKAENPLGSALGAAMVMDG